MTSQGLTVTADGPTVTVVLDRPERRGALDHATIRSLHRVLGDLQQDPARRVLLLTGTEGAFSAGIPPTFSDR